MSEYYDRNGNPLTMQEWAEAYNYDRHIGSCRRLRGPARGTKRVSTIWLGLNHAFSDGPPLIFETMVFTKESWADLDCRRYSTEDEAIRGHAAMRQKWQYNRRQRRRYTQEAHHE